MPESEEFPAKASAATVTGNSGHTMKTNAKFALTCSLVAIIGLAVGCSDLKDSLPPATAPSGVHPEGWTTPASASFHGKAIRAEGWDMGPCKVCHGVSYSGGSVQVSCLTCHNSPLGPENCATCHGSSSSTAPPRDIDGNTTSSRVGAHQTHLRGTSRSKYLACQECHSVPGSVSTPGHIDGDDRAEVLMTNYLANLQTDGGAVVPNPSYSSGTGACSNTYCHGTFKNGNASNAPVWNVSSSAACGSCHGNTAGATTAEKALPGGSHPPYLACYACHAGVIDASWTIIDASRHVDGKLNLFGSDITF